jgi:CheY-like chemotaxis protein
MAARRGVAVRLLIIDDASVVHQEFAEKLEGENVDIVSVFSRSEALSRLEEDYDLIICDLKLPADPTGGEPEIVHGLSVCDKARTSRPGIPVVILSAFGDINDLGDRLADSPREPFLGQQQIPMLRHKVKSRIDLATDLVHEHAQRLQELNRAIEITWSSDDHTTLSEYERQALLIYASTRGGVMVRLRPLTGGRSGAKALWLEIEDSSGRVVVRGVAKIDSLSRVLSEFAKFQDHVADLLPAGSFAGAVNVVRAGASDRGLIVYSLAANEVSLFKLLRERDAVSGVIDSLRQATEPWHGSKTVARREVREIRQLLVSDGELAQIRATHGDFIDFGIENIYVQANECLCHGDLHGDNVQVSTSRGSILIDFAKVGVTPACLDPITLEVSAIVHPEADLGLDDWPTLEQARVWPSPSYLENCPISEFVEACRLWLDAVKRGDRDRDATLYAYALRQLRFPEIDPQIPIALCQGAAARLSS